MGPWNGRNLGTYRAKAALRLKKPGRAPSRGEGNHAPCRTQDERLRKAALLVLLAVLFVDSIGCKRAPLTDSGVTHFFGGVGLGDGNFNYPRAIASDRTKSVYVVDKSGRVQWFDADGGFEGSWRVPETVAGFPVGLAVHSDGRVFVADTHYHRVLIYSAEGTLVGSFGEEGMGDGQFQLPTDVAIDASGNIYVSEYHENDRVTKWSPDFQFVTVLATNAGGTRLSRPTGLAVDDEQTLWLADACNHRIVRMSLDGEVLTVFGKFGSGPGELRYPYDISLAPNGELLVCEYEGNRLQWFSKDGRSLRIWGRPGRAVGKLFAPWGAVYGPHGRVYVLDSLNSRVQVIEP